MTQRCKAPAAAAAATGAGDCCSWFCDENSSQNIKPDQNIQAAIALRREFAIEALRVASVKAWHAADDLLIGDDFAAERELAVAVGHLREGARAFRELRAALGNGGTP
jgi:hypothetical protein